MIEASIYGEFGGSGCRGIVDKFCKRWPCLPTVLLIVAVDVKVVLEYLECSVPKSIDLRVVGSGDV